MPWNDLHHAAFGGRAELTAALLSKASIDIDQPNGDGFTPLIMAAQEGHHRVVRILLDNGAHLNVASNGKATALMLSSQNGKIVVAKLLADAGAGLEYKNESGCTSLHLAAAEGHFGVVKVLIGAGANLDASNHDGNTPLHLAARSGECAVVEALATAGADVINSNSFHQTPLLTASVEGHVDIVKVLVRLHLNPAYAKVHLDQPTTRAALDVAAHHGYAEVVRELLRLGIEACGGATRGGGALCRAAKNQHVDVMVMLRDAGVVDGGDALSIAISYGCEASIIFLLRQEWAAPGRTYVNARNAFGPKPLCLTPLCHAVGCASPRTVRLLLDAGADETLASRVTYVSGVPLDETPLALTIRCLGAKIVQEEPATEAQLHQLEAIRRLLLRVEATRAVSWLWASNVHVDQAAEQTGGGTAPSSSMARKEVVRIVRHGEGVRRAVLATLFRHSCKP